MGGLGEIADQLGRRGGVIVDYKKTYLVFDWRLFLEQDHVRNGLLLATDIFFIRLKCPSELG